MIRTDAEVADEYARENAQLRKRIETLEAALREIDAIATSHVKGAAGLMQLAARRAVGGEL